MEFSKTINLPKTNFSMKANLSITENNWLKFWEEEKIYEHLKKNASNFKKYILHDGPPYANGDLHLGHALNKILKDIICRTKFLNKFDVDYVPGWDCHGLPIEWKVEEEFKKKGKEKSEVGLDKFRERCRSFAAYWVGEQKTQFQRFGIQSNWKEIYLTMNKDSEVTIVEELLKFFETGDLYLGFKPVMWSVVEQTALAEAEIEYHEKTSKSIYVKFPVKNLNQTSVLIWTTTPWTIPCNKAIAYSKNLTYKIIEFTEKENSLNINKNEKIIISSRLIEDFAKLHSLKNFKIKKEISHKELENLTCDHPLHENGFIFDVKIYPSDHVTDETGTGFVHIAPNHGEEDFSVGQKYGLGNENTVNSKGMYEDNINFFKGIHVFKADEIVINQLKSFSNIISSNDYKHSYPHSWRSKAPLIYRATSQWFISMEKNDLRKKTIRAIEGVKWIPANSKNRILSMMNERPDWCVSRQRSWGVPITIFIEKKTQKPLLDLDVNKKILSVLKSKGVDSWFELNNDEFLTENYDPNDYVKVNSILDVWFDSGASHAFVLRSKNINIADLYLEGSDQHRGWFQTSLLESCGLYGTSPYKSVLTHGFVIDDKGKKMSKSLGNIISPKQVIEKYGADVLRIWVANSNFTEDVRISFENLDRHAESYRKIRNSIRFILGNLSGWKLKNRVPFEKLPELEKYVLHRLWNVNNEVKKMFNEFNFNKAFQIILNFCNTELSAFFFDIRKDSLYCDSDKSLSVNSSKTVMSFLFESLIRWLSPIIPFTTEEAWQSWREEIDNGVALSCHLLTNQELPSNWNDNKLETNWKKILELRDAFLFFHEKIRNDKQIKSTMEADVCFFLKNKNLKGIANTENLSEILICSNVSFSDDCDEDFEEYKENNDILVKIKKIDGYKCPRCWKTFKDKFKNELCGRCEKIIDENF